MSHMSMCEAPPLRKNRMVLRAVPGAVRADRPAASGDVCANTRRSPPARAEHPAAAALRKTRRFMMAVSDVQEEGPIGEISGQAERSIGHAVERQDQRYLTRLLWENNVESGKFRGTGLSCRPVRQRSIRCCRCDLCKAQRCMNQKPRMVTNGVVF